MLFLFLRSRRLESRTREALGVIAPVSAPQTPSLLDFIAPLEKRTRPLTASSLAMLLATAITVVAPGTCRAEEPAAAGSVTLTLELKEGVVESATIAETDAAPPDAGKADEKAKEKAADAIPAIPLQPAIPAVRLAPAIRVQVVGSAVGVAPADGGAADKTEPWIPFAKKEWKYWDKPEAPDDRWLETGFDDQSWTVGAAPLGYGDPDIKGLVSFGDDANDKPMVTYFRTSFELEERPDIAWVTGGLVCDDGAVVYLNGQEIERYNLPAGDLKPETAATETIGAEKERAVWDFIANRKMLRKGKNTIAVRVHQAAKTSSDIGFDLELRGASEEEVKAIRERIQKKEPRPQPVAPEATAPAPQASLEVPAPANAGENAEEEKKQEEANEGDKKEAEQPQNAAKPRAVAAAIAAMPLNGLAKAIARQARVKNADDGEDDVNGDEEPQPERNFMHISDGEVTYYQGDGTMTTQRMDAVEQVKMYVPEATMARAMEGDTLAKLARQHNLTVEHLALLNNRPLNKPFVDEEVFCVGWTYKVQKDDTFAKVARLFGSKPETVAKLNGLAPDQAITEGQQLQVPGEFKYIHENKTNRYLQIAQYPFAEQGRVHRMPYNPQSVKMRREQVPEAQTLADYAQANQTTADHLAVMNGIDPKAELEKGQWILLEYSVEIAEDPNVKLLADTFGMEEAKLRQANGLGEKDTVEAGRRMNIPIGDRMNQSLSAKQNTKPEDWPVFEVTLGEFRTAAPANP